MGMVSNACRWFVHSVGNVRHKAYRGNAGSAVEAAGNRMWWRRHKRTKSQGSISDGGGRAPLAANAGNYSHWAAFWEKQ